MTKHRTISRNLVLFVVLAIMFSVEAHAQKQNLTGVYKNTQVCGKIVPTKLDSYLKITSDSTAFLYGNGDMFDCDRGDREVNYFVAPLVDFRVDGESIRFSLYVSSFDLLTRPVALSISSTAEAICKGYVQDIDWGRSTVSSNQCFISAHYDVGMKQIRGILRKDGSIRLDLYRVGVAEKGCLFVKVKKTN